jgi:hypothetical protein
MSGIGVLRNRIESLFVRPRAVHKVARILAEVEKIARRPELSEASRDEILDGVERLRGSDAMHTLDELRALGAMYSGACALGSDAERALLLFEAADSATKLGCATEDPASIKRAALAAISHWQAFASSAVDGVSREIARTAVRSASIIHDEVKE